MPPRTLRAPLGLACALCVWHAVPAAAQNGCDIPSSDLWVARAQGTPAEMHIFTRVTVVCDDGLVIYADSAVVFPPQNLTRLFRRVRFDEGSRLLTADRADYNSRDERLQAWGSVVLSDEEGGTRMEGAEMVYLRESANRPRQRVTMTGPDVRATLYPRKETPRTAATDEAAAAVGDSTAPTIRVPGTPRAEVPRTFRYYWLWERVLALLAEVLPAREVPTPELGPPPGEPSPGAVPLLLRDPAPTDEASSSPEGSAPDTTRAPYHVVAHRRIVIEGQSAFEAEGQVEVEREGLHAFGERLRYDENWGQLHLLGAARSEGQGYQLTAEAIGLMLVDQVVREVVARERAQLSTDDIDLTAPRIRIFVQDSTVDRLSAGLLGPSDTVPVIGSAGADGVVSWVPMATSPTDSTRPVALADQFRLLADSLEVLTPHEQLERVTAIGKARGDSFTSDSLNATDTPEFIRNDWLEGDTIVARFVKDSTTAPEGDTLQSEPRGYVLEQLDARGAARSLYRLAPSDTTGAQSARLAVHYVVGDAILIVMVDGDMDHMEVQGQTQGMHLEPISLPAADSVVGDSVAVKADTARAAPVGRPRREDVPRGRESGRTEAAVLPGRDGARSPRPRSGR